MNKPLKIYRNLRKKCFSVMHYDAKKKGYRLCGHVDRAILIDVTTKVSASGRQKVLAEKQKNVHAFILAQRISFSVDDRAQGQAEIFYNPYIQETFTIGRTGKPFTGCEFALLDNSKAYILEH